MRSSSAASDPTTEKLECFLDHRSLLGMLQQRAPPSEDPPALPDSRHPLVRDPPVHVCSAVLHLILYISGVERSVCAVLWLMMLCHAELYGVVMLDMLWAREPPTTEN